MVATKYQEEAVEVEMFGLVALTNGDKAFLGNEIKLSEADSKMQQVAYRPTINSHIISHYLSFEPTVGGIVGIVDAYYGF